MTFNVRLIYAATDRDEDLINCVDGHQRMSTDFKENFGSYDAIQ